MFEEYKHIVPHIDIGSGVIDTVAGYLSQNGSYRKILTVCDKNTYKAAGERVICLLKDAGFDINELCYPEDELLPDEHSIGRLLAAYTTDTDLILGIGSGTINDLCTYVGAKTGCPSAIAGTAPSMDGYASKGSAMVLGGIKVTPMTQCPAAVFCDTDILCKAPLIMIASGLGDMLGKITSLADWRLSHLLTGEPMPDDIYGLVETALSKIFACAGKALQRDPDAINTLTEGLILSGIAMSLYGDSRPASGTEHHLAHFWEMRALANGRKPAMHGIMVAFGAVLALEMWKKLQDEIPDWLTNPIETAEGYSHYQSDIRRLYGTGADEILKTANPNLPVSHIREHNREILGIAKSLPASDNIISIMRLAGVQMTPKEIGLDTGTLTDSIIYARDRKKTYTLLQLLGDMNLLHEYARKSPEFFTRDVLSGIKCFVLDMDGTIYLGSKLFPYTHDFLARLKYLGKDFIFFTNNSSRNAAQYIYKLKNMGIDITADKLLMSTHVLLDYLDELEKSYLPPFGRSMELMQKRSVFVAGTISLKEDFLNAGYTLTEDNPNFAVLGFDTDMDYARLAKLCDFIRAGVPVYGVNMDYNCPVEQAEVRGGFIPDCGSLASAVYTSTGVMPEFFGKPSRRALDYIIRQTGYREDELCFIGDRLYTDIAITTGSKARSVLVLSGETNREDPAGSEHVPDLIVDDLEDLLRFL